MKINRSHISAVLSIALGVTVAATLTSDMQGQPQGKEKAEECRMAAEVTVVDAWSRTEAETLLTVAREHEPRFAPLLHFRPPLVRARGRPSHSSGRTSTSTAPASRFAAR